MKFGVFTDLHYDVIPDGDKRLDKLLQSFREEKVDFILELGDLCNPTEKNQTILKSLKSLGVPCYFSLGNHNIDFCSPETALNFLGLQKGYYSVVKQNVKFIFLDANYIRTSSGYLPECKSNLADKTGQFPYIPPEQIQWLKNELNDDKFYVICSHQSLSNDHIVGSHSRGVVNREDIRNILEKANSNGNKILFCLNGNDHGDSIREINGIYYYSLNSVSYIWQGVKETFNYSLEIHKQYPHLKNLILYKEPLHIIVTIDEKMNIIIQGMNGHYQNVTPKEIGIGDTWNGVSIKPQTSSLTINRRG